MIASLRRLLPRGNRCPFIKCRARREFVRYETDVRHFIMISREQVYMNHVYVRYRCLGPHCHTWVEPVGPEVMTSPIGVMTHKCHVEHRAPPPPPADIDPIVPI